MKGDRLIYEVTNEEAFAVGTLGWNICGMTVVRAIHAIADNGPLHSSILDKTACIEAIITRPLNGDMINHDVVDTIRTATRAIQNDPTTLIIDVRRGVIRAWTELHMSDNNVMGAIFDLEVPILRLDTTTWSGLASNGKEAVGYVNVEGTAEWDCATYAEYTGTRTSPLDAVPKAARIVVIKEVSHLDSPTWL